MKIEIRGNQCIVTAPYNSGFVAAAKKLGGKWSTPNWVFDARNEGLVRDACYTWYGSDGIRTDLCTLRVVYPERKFAEQGPVEVSGRTVARAYGRDSGAKWGDGIVCLHGDCDSGGSVKNWTTVIAGGTIVLIRDFPRQKAEALVKKDSSRFSIEPEPGQVPGTSPESDRLMEIARRLRESGEQSNADFLEKLADFLATTTISSMKTV